MEEPGTQDNEFEDLAAGGIPDSSAGDADFGDLSFGSDDAGLDFDSMDSLELGEIELGDGGDAFSDDAESLDPGQPGDELSADFDLDFPADAEPAADAAVDAPAFEDSLEAEDVSFDEVPALNDEMGFDDFPGDDLELPAADESTPEVFAEGADGDSADDEPVMGTSFFDETDDETVALSEDELEDILGNTDEAFFEDFGDGAPTGADESADGFDGAAALDTEDGRLELNEIRSDDELVPEPDLEPINPPDGDFGAGDESGELEELSFDDFDAPSAPMADPLAGDSTDPGQDSPADAAFSDEELELALELNDEAGEDLAASGVATDLDPGDGADAGASPLPGFLDEGDDDEPIALSEDELDNIMGDVDAADGMEAIEPTESFETFDTTADDDSGDPFAADELSDDMLSGMSEDMSADPLDPLDPMDPMAAGDEFADSFDPGAENEEDENITLSDDELSQVLLDADSEDAPGADDDLALADDAFPDAAQTDAGAADEDVPAPPSLSSLDMDDDEPIALTAEELGNIVSEVEGEEMVEAAGVEPDAEDLGFLDSDDAEPVAEMMVEEDTDLDFSDSADSFAADEPFGDSDDEDLGPAIAEFENSDEDGSVALSDSELGSILEDTDTETLAAEGQTPPDEFDAVAAGDADEFADGNVIVLDEYEDDASGADEGPVVEGPPEIAEPEPEPASAGEMAGEAGAAAAAAAGAAVASGLASRAEQLANETNLDREELRTMISYLDGLFDALPDEAVRQFSQSSYFDLYKKIMTELGLS